MHRYDTTCHWCGELKPVWRMSGPALRSAAAIALTVTAAAGAWRYGPALLDGSPTATSPRTEKASLAARATLPAVTAAPTATQAASATNPGNVAANAHAASQYAGANDVRGYGTEAGSGAGSDSVVWTPAVARTWVNVRSDASRGGEVLGVIEPESVTLLGTNRAGWRQVRISNLTGWVDPRLFEPDSSRSRGD